MMNSNCHRARAFVGNQAGNSTVGYLILATLVGVAGVVSLSLFGTASELAIAGKAASAATATPLMGGNSAAAMIRTGDEADADGAASFGVIDKDGVLISDDGTAVARLKADGTLVHPNGTVVGRVMVVNGQHRTIVVNGKTFGTLRADGVIVGAHGLAEAVSTEEASASAPGPHTRSYERSAKSEFVSLAKIVGSMALFAAGVATAVVFAPVSITVAGVAIAAIGGFAMFKTITDETQVAADFRQASSPAGWFGKRVGARLGETPLDRPNEPGDKLELDSLLTPYGPLLSKTPIEESNTMVYADSDGSTKQLKLNYKTTAGKVYLLRIAESPYPANQEQVQEQLDGALWFNTAEQIEAGAIKSVYQRAGIDFGSSQQTGNVLAIDSESERVVERADGSKLQLFISRTKQPNADGTSTERTRVDLVETNAPKYGRAHGTHTTWWLTPDSQAETFNVVDSKAVEFTARS